MYLLSEKGTGQKATAVAESPTSKMEEHGLISGSSNPHRPHTTTWTHTHKYEQLTIWIHYITTSMCNHQFFHPKSNVVFYLLVPTGGHKVFAVWAPVTWPDDSAVYSCVLPCVCIQRELGLCTDPTNTNKYRDSMKNEFKLKTLPAITTLHVLCHISFIEHHTFRFWWHELAVKTLCHAYCSMTSACLDPYLAVLSQRRLSRLTHKQPNKTENLIPALHFSQFWFMTCCCLFP